MAKKLMSIAISALLSAFALFLVGLSIWFFKRGSNTSLQDILFYVGAFPIALFSIGLFGDFVGRGTSSYQISRSVTRKTAHQRAVQDSQDAASRVTSGLNWFAAGLLVWLVSFFCNI